MLIALLTIFFITCCSTHDINTHSQTTKLTQSPTRITYSSLIKLHHITTNYWLHSHQIRISRGGALSVTAYKQDDHGSYWQLLQQNNIKHKKTYRDYVKCGDSLMIYSSICDYYLRTDQTQFGMTTQLLPLVHGIKKINNNQLDHSVVWTVQCADKQIGDYLHFGDNIRLKHDTTGKYVSTDGSSFYTQGNCGRGCQIVGQLELHAQQNGHYSDDTLFKIQGGLVFDSTLNNNNVQQSQSQ